MIKIPSRCIRRDNEDHVCNCDCAGYAAEIERLNEKLADVYEKIVAIREVGNKALEDFQREVEARGKAEAEVERLQRLYDAEHEERKRMLSLMELLEYKAQARAEKAEAEVEHLRETFRHTHQGPGDPCRQCGLDIRDRVHTRAED